MRGDKRKGKRRSRGDGGKLGRGTRVKWVRDESNKGERDKGREEREFKE